MLRLTQILDEQLIIDLQERLTALLGMSIVFEEPLNGSMSTIGPRGRVCDSCTRFIDVEGQGKKMCLESDRDAYYNAVRHARIASPGRTVAEFYICNGRMRNFAIPISIGGEILGCVYAGQFLVDLAKDKSHGRLDEVLSRLDTELAYERERSVKFGTPPTLDEIDEIARLNNICDESRVEFRESYEQNLAPERLKSLEDVVNAVYLLDEIAHTISTLGNAYYLERLVSRVRSAIPAHLQAQYSQQLGELEKVTRGWSSERTEDLTDRLRRINASAFDILSQVKAYEEEYVANLLRPYDENLVVTDATTRLRLKHLTAQCRYRLGEFETVMRTARAALSGNTVLDDLNKEYDGLKDVSGSLSEIELGTRADPFELLSETGHKLDNVIRHARSAIDAGQRTGAGPSHDPTIDEVEHLFYCLGDPIVGLRELRRAVSEHRSLSGLESLPRGIRCDLRLRYDVIYLNVGGIAPTTDSVLAAQREWNSQSNEHGPVSQYTESLLETPTDSILERTRSKIANFVGAHADEIVFTDNTTKGVEAALSMTLFKDGEAPGSDGEILLTTQEHDAVRNCCEHMARLSGARLAFIDLQFTDKMNIPEKFAERLTKRTKAVVVSHVVFCTGRVLDIAAISGSILERAKSLGIAPPAIVVDGAQAVGQLPVDVRALGCDFYAADGHKWLLGPPGSGFVFVARKYFQGSGRALPVYRTYMIAPRHRPKSDVGREFEPATMNVAPIAGLERAIDVLGSPGSPKEFAPLSRSIQKRADVFRALLSQELAGLDVTIAGDAPGMVILSFGGLEEDTAIELYSNLRRQLDKHFGVICRSIDSPPCLRFCIHCFVSDEELTIAIRALKRLLQFDYQDVTPYLLESREIITKRMQAMENLDEIKNASYKRAQEHLRAYGNVIRTKYEKGLIQLPAKYMERVRKTYAKNCSVVDALAQEVEQAIRNATTPDAVADEEERVLREMYKALESHDEE